MKHPEFCKFSLIAGSALAMIQSAVLFHALADTYPYKMMSTPSDRFYSVIGSLGLAVAPVLAVLAGWALVKGKTALVPAIAGMLCPMVFLAIFAAAHVLCGVDQASQRNYDGTTPAAVFGEFTRQVFTVFFQGSIFGGVTSFFVEIAIRTYKEGAANPGDGDGF